MGQGNGKRITEIPERLVVPDTLKARNNSRRVIPFIGAGVSRVLGLPNWDGFANAVIEQIIEHDTGLINHAQYALIKTLSPRTRLSIAQKIITQHKVPIVYQKIFELKERHKETNNFVNKALAKISSQIVTTNYDDLLAREWKVEPLPDTLKEDETHPSVKIDICDSFDNPTSVSTTTDAYERTVYHIHGRISDEKKMIVSTKDYLDRYSARNEKNDNYINFLTNIFNDNNVIFIGYGTDELEILEYIFQKGFAEQTSEKKLANHYILEGFYSYEVGKAQLISDYFISLGIHLIPYSLDKEGYDCLPNIIDELASEINKDPNNKLAFKRVMRELLDE